MSTEPERIGDLPEHIAAEVQKGIDLTGAKGRGPCLKPHRDDVEVHLECEHCDRHPEATYRHNEMWLTGCEICRAEAREREHRESLRQLAEAMSQRCDRDFPPRYRAAVADHPGVLEWVQQFQQDPTSAPSLLILGPTGVGKTYQAYGALRSAVVGYAYGFKVTTSADLMAGLRPRPGVDTEEVMSGYRNTDLLLIDDFGVAKQSEWVEETLYRVINGRYERMLPTIYTTNLAVAQLRDALGDRIASRLAETCTRVLLEGGDRRRQR